MIRSFQEIAKQAPIGLCILRGENFMVEMANDAYLQLIDKTEAELVGKELFAVIPEVKEVVEPLLLNVLRSGTSFTATDFEVYLKRHGGSERAFFNLIYQALRNAEGEISGIIVIASEVTELVESRHLLEEKERIFRNMVLDSPIAMAVFKGKQQVVEMANKNMLQNLWRRTFEQVEGRPLLEIFPELEGQVFPGLLDDVYETGKVFSAKEAEAYIDADDGRKLFYLDFEYAPLRDPQQQHVVGVMVSVYDVTDAVFARKKASEAEDRLRLAIEATRLGNYEVNYTNDEMMYSKSFLEIFGLDPNVQPTRDELVEKIHPDDLGIRKRAHEQSLVTGNLEYEFRVMPKEGETRWVKTRGTVVFDEDNKPVKLAGTVLDITDEKLTLLALKNSEQKFRILADTLPALVWIADASGHLYYFNRSVYEYSGLSEVTLNKVGWLDIVHPDDRESNLKAWIQSVETGEPFIFEHRFRRHDGVYRWQLSRAVPQYNANGQIEMWVGSSTDIHDHRIFTDELEKQVQERTVELRNSNEALVKSNTELAQFAYVASHDLQEPLRKIQTFTTLINEMEKGKLSDRGMEIFKRIRSTADRMQQLVIDLLSYSRVNKVDNHFAKTDLTYLMDSILNELEESVEQRKIRVQVDPLPTITAIPFQMEQLFTNLLSNSVKFSDPQKASELHVRYAFLPAGSLEIPALKKEFSYHQFEIADNGIGFDNEYREKIFQVFQRLHGKEAFPGTGIGLAICKKIIDNHQGAMIAHGEVGKGATFTIYIPDFEI